MIVDESYTHLVVPFVIIFIDEISWKHGVKL